MKRIILTGASGGLATAFAKKCIKENIEIIAIGRNKPAYACVFLKTDLTNEKEIEQTCKIIAEKYPRFDAIVNAAGAISVQDADKITYNELENVMRVNSIAPIFLVSKLYNLIKANEADVMNIGSTMGTKATTSQSAYVSSKWAIRGASGVMNLEFANSKCRVMQINVGGMNTDFWGKYNGTVLNPDDWMNPEDIADMLLYFLNLPKKVQISEITIDRKKF